VKQFYLSAKPSPMQGRCGWVSLPSAPAYNSKLLGEGTWLIYQELSCLVITVDGGAF
jgi:hypothetical protein